MIELFKEGMRFGIVGVFATIVHVAAAWIANHFGGAAPYAANALGWIFAIIVGYLGHFYWTFGRRGNQCL